MYKNLHQKYQKMHITTASKEKILLMLYQGAIRYGKQIQLAMKENDIKNKGIYISKLISIISELMASLDFKSGGQLAKDLEQLYIFIIDETIEANITNNVKHLENIQNILNILYTGWEKIIN